MFDARALVKCEALLLLYILYIEIRLIDCMSGKKRRDGGHNVKIMCRATVDGMFGVELHIVPYIGPATCYNAQR